MRCDGVKVDYDEGDWILTFSVEDADGFTLPTDEITMRMRDDVAFDLDDALSHVRERKREFEYYKQMFARGVLTPSDAIADEMREAYDADDPKHPDFLEFADILRKASRAEGQR